MTFVPMLVAGFLTSFHCLGMCGPLVVTYAVGNPPSEAGWKRRMVPHLAYHSAKILSYTLVGSAAGALGAALGLKGAGGWVALLAGAFMVLLGLNLLGVLPWVRYLTLRSPRFLKTAIAGNRRRAADEEAAGRPHLATPVVFGLLTGLMPCGPLQAAELYAAGTGSAVSGAVTMLAFGLGTVPVMLGFGTVSTMLSEPLKRRMMSALAVVVVALGLVMLNRGAMLVGSPVTFESVRVAVLGQGTRGPGGATGQGGVYEVPIKIENTRFVPDRVSVPADRPIRLLVDRRESVACSDQIAIPQLGVLADLKPFAVTAVDVPAAKAGTYTLTCGMGMMSGSFVVDDVSR